MFVITADQDASRRTGDRVEAILEHLASRDFAGSLDLNFQRTVGDEIQGVTSSASLCLTAALELQRAQEWAVGIGVGEATLTDEAVSSSGSAFIHARTAVERAGSKAVNTPISVIGGPEDRTRDAEALLQLLSSIVRRRSQAGWEIADLLTTKFDTHRQAATALGISPQAASQRLQAAMWNQERAVHPLAVRLLSELDEGNKA